ncbi:Guanosine-3',5'-bis(Diphosphate) 3'-pyrophosphohydrolase (plasmid) [Euzebya pacifica]|uniref:Guanosine-3',5'-bis(Diphosphate) 3'-pyrophosphohydrolase n=1 Tax=Euzebya pacifica TaxID=1608957 RepID=A0A346Y6L2_9ACTN|nr:HD domain-containing protein [Euzebya pacifica]AXV10109.1 Guanosine-3',5'-bis(Diphosphate) 3'-pyrophosphohydrolase [Euzebya pacifica]
MRPDRALDIATTAHNGQTDKAGRPYIGHVHRVLGHLPDDATDDHRVVAALHDVVEDTDVTLDQLRADGLTDTQAAAVDAMTRRADEPKDDYYRRVAANPIALVVKAADIDDNADPARLAVLDPDTRDRLAAKYTRARQALGLTSS